MAILTVRLELDAALEVVNQPPRHRQADLPNFIGQASSSERRKTAVTQGQVNRPPPVSTGFAAIRAAFIDDGFKTALPQQDGGQATDGTRA